MLQFATPLGLLALGTLLVPVLLHLVRRPLRVIKVGSLRPLQETSRPVRSLRWRAWLLLLLRCALLAALALSLAGARWNPSTPSPVRWALITPGLQPTDSTRAEWTRLRGEGFELRRLAAGFPQEPRLGPLAPAEIDTWSLLRAADFSLPAGSRIVVFGPTWSNQFRGARPSFANVEVTWRPTPGDPPKAVAPSPIRVGLVATPDRDEDARYLRAMFAATGVRVVDHEPPEWMFQLGDAALPPVWMERLRQGAHLVTDAPNRSATFGVNRTLGPSTREARVRHRIALSEGAAVFRDSAGEPWLTEERIGAGRHWRLAVRLHPDWTDWPLGSGFPAWWREHLSAVPPIALAVDPAQAAPGFAPGAKRSVSSLGGIAQIDLRGWCWLLAAGLFGLERTVTALERRRKAAA